MWEIPRAGREGWILGIAVTGTALVAATAAVAHHIYTASRRPGTYHPPDSDAAHSPSPFSFSSWLLPRTGSGRQAAGENGGSSDPSSREEKEEPAAHPCAEAVLALQEAPGEDWWSGIPPVAPEPLASSEFFWVDSKEALEALASQLASAPRFAFDCEHNALRSYRGQTCLLQISTGRKDFVVDCLALASELGPVLGPPFADPAVTKVVHGGENDVLWLQRDFGIRLANVHDTQKLARAAACQQSLSLGHLLLTHCGVRANKAFQSADWRMRPLPAPLLEYARTDVHYLLHIHDMLVQELQDKHPSSWMAKLGDANRRSQRMALATYKKASPDATVKSAAMALLRQHLQSIKRPGGDVTRDCIRALCGWRDTVAREVDEGLQYVLPDPAILALAASGRLRSTEQLLAAVQGSLPQAPPEHQFGHCSKAREVSWVLVERQQEVLEVLSRAQKGELPWMDADVIEMMGRLCSAQKKAKGDKEKQEAIKARLVKKFSAKTPVYENCRMLSQEGELLCHCDRRKMLWYVHKGLAEFVEGDTSTIKLKFQHKNADKPDSGANSFYAASKANECVVCGETEHYLRYRIVPSCYRRNFPTHLKSHRSHDIVLVCLPCHENAQRSADEVKRELAAEHSIPLNPPPIWLPSASGNQEDDYCNGAPALAAPADAADLNNVAIPEANKKHGIHASNARRAAQALAQHASTMPDSRRAELVNVIKIYLGRDPSSEPPCLQPGDLVDARVAGVTARRRKRVIQQLARELGESPHPDLGVTSGPDVLLSDRLLCSNKGGDGEGIQDEASGLGDAEQADGGASSSCASSGASRSHRDEKLERNGGHAWHGERIVTILLDAGGDEALLQLIRRFRERFVERLQPRHLPSGWAIAHQAPREFGPHSIFCEDDNPMSGMIGAPDERLILPCDDAGLATELPSEEQSVAATSASGSGAHC